jgi:hypothetical protein
MSGIAARFVKILVLAGLALAVTASSGAAGSPARVRILGVVPHAGGQLARAPIPHTLSKAVRAAGPTTLTFDATYQSVINQFFTEVAHDSGGVNNVYPVATQYFDNPGGVHIQYQSTFGGSYVAHDPLPANGCNDGLDTYCLTDQQLQHEIQTAMTAQGWVSDPSHIFFLMTPNGVGSCESARGSCSTDTFCAYHSDFVDSNGGHVIYANEPYEGTDPQGGCIDPSQGFPNDPEADTTINTISHEHNEAITDPLTDPSSTAWIAADGNENGDLCAYSFGAPLGTAPNGQPYNQLINNHPYSLQQEWSNQEPGAKGCIQRPGDPNPSPPTLGHGPLLYEGGPVMHTNTAYAIYWLPTARNKSAPVVTGTAVVNKTLLDRDELRPHPRRHGQHVQADDHRRWPRRALDGQRDQRERRFAACRVHRYQDGGRRPGRHQGAAYLGPCTGRKEAVGQPRRLDVFPRVRLPVAALQRARRELQEHQPRDAREVQADGARCEAPAAPPRHRHQRGRPREGDLRDERARQPLAPEQHQLNAPRRHRPS